MTGRANQVNWLLFGLLGLIWGSSYLFIKIGVDAIGPFTLVTLRCLFAGLFLAAVVRAAGQPLPRNGRLLAHLAMLGVLSIFVPFVLIAWGEQHVISGLAAVLNATTPLFTVLVAPLVLRDEPFRLNRMAGVLIGFVGVAIVVAPTIAEGPSADPLAFPAQVAITVAAASYAIGAVYARRFVPATRPMTISLGMVIFGGLMTAPLALALEDPFARGLPLDALFASAWLGVLGSGVGLLIFYRLLAAWGATRTHIVVYLLPPVGVALGVIVLSEPLHAALILGTALILGGAALTNARMERRARPPVAGTTAAAEDQAT